MGKLNHHAIDNCDVKITTSEFPVDSKYDPVPYPYTTPIKSIDDGEMDHLLELFHSLGGSFLVSHIELIHISPKTLWDY